MRPFSHRRSYRLAAVLLGLGVVFSAFNTFGIASAFSFPTVAGCPVNKRLDNWGTFVSDGLSIRDFYANFSDIFTKNSCQQTDILILQKAIDAAQHELRQKIFSCKESGIAALSQKINDLKFELEYVRAAIDTDEEKPDLEGAKGIIPHRDTLAQMLSASTVVKRGLISSERFQQLFPQLEQKYAFRLQNYRSCTDPTWQALADSWNTFVQTWGGLSPAWNKAKVATETRFSKVLDTPSDRSGQFLGGFLSAKLNNLPPRQTLQGIYQSFLKTTPGLSGTSSGSVDQSAYLNAIDSDAARYAAQEDYARRRAYYEFLYRISHDNAAAVMKKEVNDLNATLESSLPVMDQVRGGVACIAQRQCGGQ